MQKPSRPHGRGRLQLPASYCVFFSVVSLLVEELAPADGVVEPLAAPLLGAVLDELAPPAASFFSVSVEAELDADEDGGVAGVVEELVAEELSLFFDASTFTEPEAEPDGDDGVVVEPADDEDEPDGGVVVVELRETARSPSLSQPVSIAAPSANETATAKVVSLITRSSVGWGKQHTEQGLGLTR